MDNNHLILVYQSCEYLDKQQTYELAELLTKMTWKASQAFTEIGLDKEDMYFICWQSINTFHEKYGRLEFDSMKKIISMTFKRRIFDRIRTVRGRGSVPKTQVIYNNDLCLYNSSVLENGTKDINFRLYCDYYLDGLKSTTERKTIKLLLEGHNKKEVSDIMNLSQSTVSRQYNNFVDSYKTMLN
ncbi:hypothetical protein [Spiroplasma endosymbiont of Othius punctulatus]|uniref:helix-turn-helix transcriptional regulator n=1 Tax=Spiroplasma endosymbiont of Othius punctulatus TaxID=3066289 RepID=UPI0030D4AF73